jgi:hypothetical protein
MSPPSWQAIILFPLWPVVIGFLVTVALGRRAGSVVKRAGDSISLELPPTVSAERRLQWKELTSGNEGGEFIGRIERFIFFVAFLIGAPVVVGGWLAFKVASKWNAWTNITAVPKQVEGLADLDAAIGRRRWASHVLTTFLVGTGYNVCAGMLGAAVARSLAQLSKLAG